MQLVLLVFLLAPRALFALFPNQPELFRNRASVPHLAFSFRQVDCKNGSFLEDIANTLSLQRSIASSSCPTRSTGFTNAAIGVSITNNDQRDALKSSPISTAFSTFTTDATLHKQLSVEMWITPLVSLDTVVEYHLMEIGGNTGSSSLMGGEDDNVHMKVTLQRGVGVKLSYVQSSNKIQVAIFSCPALLNTALLQSGNEVGNTLFLAITLDGTVGASFSNAKLYLGRAGVLLTQCSTSGNQQGEQIDRFVLPDTAVLRVASTRAATYSSTMRGFHGEVNLLAFYDTALTATQVQDLLTRGLPNSNPVLVSEVWFTLQQSTQEQQVDLTSINSFDQDSNPMQAFYLYTLPQNGTLYYNHARVDQVPFAVLNHTLLAYVQTDPLGFSQSDVSQPCVAKFDSFQVVASDGLCDHTSTPQLATNCLSPKPSTVLVCVHDAVDLPVAQNVEDQLLRLGSSIVFEVTAEDLDDFQVDAMGVPSVFRLRTSNTTYSSTARVYFNHTAGAFGRIVHVTSNGDCNATQPVQANKALTPVTLAGGGGVQRFLFCYLPTVTAQIADENDIVGVDIFAFQFQDVPANPRGPMGTIKLTILNPLEVCPQDSCSTAFGFEDAYIPISLQGRDFIGARDLFVEICSLPLHGKLYENIGTSLDPEPGNELVVGSQLVASVSNALFLGNEHYFTRINSTLHMGLSGSSFNNCPKQEGCPVTFEYKAVVAGEQASQIGTFSLHIDSTPTLPVISAPLRFVVHKDATKHQILDLELRDVDQDAYMVSVSVSLLNVDSTEGKLHIPGLTNEPVQQVTFSALPSRANVLLQSLEFVVTRISNETQAIVIRVHKPALENEIVIATIAVDIDPESYFEEQSEWGELETGIVAGSLFALGLLMGLGYFMWRRRISSSKAAEGEKPPSTIGELMTVKEEEEEEEWGVHVDEKTGDLYYFNSRTGQSQWTDPRVVKFA